MQPRCNHIQDKRISNGINRKIENFQARGIIAPFNSRRGRKIKTSFLTFNGVNSFALGKRLHMTVDRNIDRRRIYAIELVGNTARPAIGGGAGIDNAANDIFGFLAVVDNCGEILARIALSTLNLEQNGNKLCFTDFQNVDWGACFVTVLSGSADDTNGLLFKLYTS